MTLTKATALGAALFLIASGPALSMTIEDYRGVSAENQASFLLYLNGVGAGYGWANSYAESTGTRAPLFCEPDGLSLDASNYKHILDFQLSKSAKLLSSVKDKDTSVELMLLTGLIEAFPCK